MANDLYVALTGALGRLQELDVAANNLANADTAGFKRVRTGFSAALEAATRDLDGQTLEGASAAVFAVVGTPRVDLSAGPVESTGNPLDAAIDGPGFFVVEGPDGPRYTRAGSFIVGPDGNLATPEGFAVQGDGGPIAVADGSVRIAGSGALIDDRLAVVGRLQIVDFEDASVLVHDGNNTLRADGAAPVPLENPRVVEASVERSNVRPVEELAALIEIQRGFDIVMRSLQADAELRQRLLQEISS